MNVVVPYAREHADQVNRLVLSIQQEEFGFPITLQDQPDLQDVERFFRAGQGNFWVSVADGSVIGTIGLVDIGNRQFALRKMFVHRDFRGAKYGVAARLLDTAVEWARQRGFRQILLGTTDKFHAAHRFYEKHGFVRVAADDLPSAFPRMAVDSIFYSREIADSAAPATASAQ